MNTKTSVFNLPSKPTEAVVQKCSVKTVLLKTLQNSQGNTYASLFFNKVAGLGHATLLKKETLAQVFFSEFCKIFKNTFFNRTPLVVVSQPSKINKKTF